MVHSCECECKKYELVVLDSMSRVFDSDSFAVARHVLVQIYARFSKDRK